MPMNMELERNMLALRRPAALQGHVRVRRGLRWAPAYATLRGESLVLSGAVHSVTGCDLLRQGRRRQELQVTTAAGAVLRLRMREGAEWAKALSNAAERVRHRDELEELSVLGRGGGGTVSLVRRVRDGRLLALKRLQRSEAYRSASSLKHAVHERLALEVLRGAPYVAQLEAAYEEDEALVLVTEFCGGGDLRGALRRNGKVDQGDVRRIASELLCALRTAHRRGVLYRDLKPENVLLTADGSVRLCDFGLALVGDDHPPHATAYCGTPGYMAPEVVARGQYGTAADVWSFGVLIYELLLGVAPFEGPGDEHELQARVRLDEPPMPLKLSGAARLMLRNMLQKDDIERWTLDEVAECDFFQGVDWHALERRGVAQHMAARSDTYDEDLFVVKERDSEKTVVMRPGAVLLSTDNVAGFAYDARWHGSTVSSRTASLESEGDRHDAQDWSFAIRGQERGIAFGGQERSFAWGKRVTSQVSDEKHGLERSFASLASLARGAWRRGA